MMRHPVSGEGGLPVKAWTAEDMGGSRAAWMDTHRGISRTSEIQPEMAGAGLEAAQRSNCPAGEPGHGFHPVVSPRERRVTIPERGLDSDSR